MTASSLVMLSSLAVAMVPEPKYEGHVYKATWATMISSGGGQAIGGGGDASNPTGGAGTLVSDVNHDLAVYADKTVQFTGVFGSSVLSSAQLLGSNDKGANWFPLKDAFGNAISMSSGGLAQITECAEKIMPITPGGDATTAVNCQVYMRKMII